MNGRQTTNPCAIPARYPADKPRNQSKTIEVKNGLQAVGQSVPERLQAANCFRVQARLGMFFFIRFIEGPLASRAMNCSRCLVKISRSPSAGDSIAAPA